MIRPGKLIYGSKIIILLTIILVVSASSTQRESKKAQNTISRFLRSKTGTSWLAKLAQTKSGPLTTRELMDQLIKVTKPDGKVSQSAKILRKALETQKLKKGDSDDGPDAWDDLIKDLGNQDDIICLYRKNSNSSMRKADDWKKFLKSVSIGYTLHLALDKGKKYVICLKKIDVPEVEDTTGSRTTEEVPSEMTSQKADLEETTKEPDGEDNSKEITKDVETTDINQISEIEEISEPKLKLPETRKSKFGPSINDIKEAESEEDSEEESEECSEEDSEEDDNEDDEDGPDQKIEKAVEDDTNQKPEHPQCNRPIIFLMQNPYGSPESPNFSQLYFPQVSKNPLQPLTNRPQNFVYPITPTPNLKHRLPFRYPFSNNLNNYPKSYPKSQRHPKHFRTLLPKTETSDRKQILNLSNPKSDTKVQKPSGKYTPLYTLKTTGHNLKPRDRKRSRKTSEKELKDPERNWYLENPKLPLGTNNNQMPIFDLPNSRPRIGPNLFVSSIPIRNTFPNKWNRYNPLLLNQSPYLIGSNKNVLLSPKIQKCFPSFPEKFGKNQWNLKPYRNLQLDPISYWMNQPNNQQMFPNQLILPNNKQILPNNQERLPNNQPTFTNSESSLDNPNSNPNSGKCPSLCDKPIELRITVEGNVDKPVKIGVLSQPGTWINIVDNNNERNSRRMLEKKENIVEDENEENEREDESEETEEVTENFNDELIENPEKALEKETVHKKNLDQKEDNDNEETEKKKAETEAEARILPEVTTLPVTKLPDTTEITVPPV